MKHSCLKFYKNVSKSNLILKVLYTHVWSSDYERLILNIDTLKRSMDPGSECWRALSKELVKNIQKLEKRNSQIRLF